MIFSVKFGIVSLSFRRTLSDIITQYGKSFIIYEKYDIIGKDISAKVEKGKKDFIKVKYENSVSAVLTKAEFERVQFFNEIKKDIKAPISKGEILGHSLIYIDDFCIGKVNLISCEDIERLGLFENFENLFLEWIKIIC